MSFSLYACLKIRNVRSPVCRVRSLEAPWPAIELQGVVKRFGPITAVDGLDLEVPRGICLGLLGPNGAGKSTTMRLLTGQAIADAGELRVLGHELPQRGQGGARRDGRRAAARQPRHRRDRRGQPRRVRAPLPRRGRARRGRARARRWRACGRAAATRSTSSRAGCAAGCCSRAGSCTSPPLMLLDEPTVGLDPQIRTELWSLIDGLRSRGHHDPDVDALHRGGRAARRRGGRDGARQDHRPRPARRPDRRARGPRDGRGLRAARRGSPRCARRPRRRACACAPPARRSRSSAPSGRSDGAVPADAVRRAASLEDVFVLLTGEEAE